MTTNDELRKRPSGRRVLDALPPLPLLALAGGAAFLIVRQGGSNTNAWYEVALAMLGLFAAVAFGLPGPIRIAGKLEVALAGFVVYTAWCFASIAWSGAKGTAWDGANRTALYLIVFAVFALVPLRRGTAATLLIAYGTAVAAIGSFVFVTTTSGNDPLQAFIGGRLADPIGYPNGNAALFMLGFWCVLPFVASARVPVAARLVSAAAATVNLDLSLLAQSRGGTVAAIVSAILYLAVASNRSRAFMALAVCTLSSLIATHDLFHVYRVATNGGDLYGTLRDARLALLWSAALAVVATGAVLAFARLTRGSTFSRLVERVGPVALGAAVVAAVSIGAVLAVVHRGTVEREARTRWHQFTTRPTTKSLIEPGSSHFAADLGVGGRYDMWRVAWLEFRSHPLDGVGVDNFGADYVRLRRLDQEPAYPHSGFLRLLSQTGLVGALAFCVFVGAVVWRLVRANRAHPGPWVPAAIAGFGYWLLHGSVDWLWEIPAVTISALILVGAALALPPPPDRARLDAAHARLALAAFCVAVAISLALPWLAIREQMVALGTWRSDPAAADKALARARSFNRLSDQPDVLAGAIAARRHDYVRMRLGFTRAIERNPAAWYSHLELATVAALQGSRVTARRELAIARRLNPREPTIGLVEAGLEHHKPVKPAELDRLFLARVATRNWPGVQVRRP